MYNFLNKIRTEVRKIINEIELFTREFPFEIERETDKAILAKIPYIFDNHQAYFTLWCPKSIIKDNHIPEWFVMRTMQEMKEKNPTLKFDHIKPTLGEYLFKSL